MRAAAAPGQPVAVCGTVNARNSYGGYVGAKLFAGKFDGDRFVMRSIGGDQFANQVTYGYCTRYGVVMT